MRIVTKRMELVPYSEELLLRAILSPHDVARDIGAVLEPLSREALERLRKTYAMRRYLIRRYPDEWQFSTMWQMVMRESRTLVGELGFKGPPLRNEVEIGYFTHEGHRGRGLMTEAVMALTDYVLEEESERIRFVSAATRGDNIASLKVLHKCGFQRTDDRFQYILFRKYPARAEEDGGGK
ncbi:GNAT family N-acetyltransferase [Oscillospiraceae bacterium OttesenSCG-928-G22]|nr:GNAT family N-acetyltransferase [Oscillospiraceae bacterium OttesenSCG-928-G22]